MPFLSQNTTPYRFGVVQTVTASRSIGTTYTNTTGKNLLVVVLVDFTALSVSVLIDLYGYMEYVVGGGLQTVMEWSFAGMAAVNDDHIYTATFVVPPGCQYRLVDGSANVTTTLVKWIEAY